MKRLLLSAVFAMTGAAASAEPLDVAGMWLTKDKDSYVEIRDCGDGTPCGYIVGPAEGYPVTQTHDIYNPDPGMRDRPLRGMKMIYGFQRRGEGWRKGKIYDPTSGKTYGSRLKLMEDGHLQVKGCLGPICQTQVWFPTIQNASLSEGDAATP